MIAVIADDFTGAAEIGGVGLRYGLKVLIETVVNKVSDVDLLVIATDTRSLSEEAASEEVARITEKLLKLNPKFIFKKIDSVLRGHVAKELEAQMHVTNQNSALIVAANPSMGRTIVNGQYFVDSIPLDQTSFASDPDFPVRSSFIKDIVQSSEFPVYSIGLKDKWPDSGLIIANVSDHKELAEWSVKLNEETIVAGGSGFFGALLGSIFVKKALIAQADLSFGESSLIVFGSKFPKIPSVMKNFENNKVVCMNMPEALYYNTGSSSDILNEWSTQITTQLKNGFSALITIDHQPLDEHELSLRLGESIGQLVAKVEDQFKLTDLIIEGGATTFVVLKYLNIKKLFPFNEADFGIIQMKADGYSNLCITTKPGSYLWPDHFAFENR